MLHSDGYRTFVAQCNISQCYKDSLCSGCLQIPSGLVTGLSRKYFLNEISACRCSLDITRRAYGYVEAHQFCGLKCFCLIQWSSTGL